MGCGRSQRYAGWFETPEPDLQDGCYCKSCITEFCESEGVDADSPQQIQTEYESIWARHKCRRIAKFAARYVEIIKSLEPSCLVGAYMCPYTPAELDGALARIFAQDYALLSETIDVFTPLIYAEKSGRGSDWGRNFWESSPGFVPSGKPVQPILDYLDFPDSLTEMIRSEVPAWGFQMFLGAKMFERETDRKIFARAVRAIAAANPRAT